MNFMASRTCSKGNLWDTRSSGFTSPPENHEMTSGNLFLFRREPKMESSFFTASSWTKDEGSFENPSRPMRPAGDAIRSREEAAAYLDHPVLGPRLLESGETLLALPTGTASEIFGGLDAMKLKSCMTLFAEVAQQHSVFQDVLERYFHGERDRLTVDILKADRSRRQGPLPNR